MDLIAREQRCRSGERLARRREAVAQAERLEDARADLRREAVAGERLDQHSGKNEASIRIARMQARLGGRFDAVSEVDDFRRLPAALRVHRHVKLELRDAAAMINQLADADAIGIGKIGEPFGDRRVERGLAETFGKGGFRYVYCIHTDHSARPHAHIIVKPRSEAIDAAKSRQLRLGPRDLEAVRQVLTRHAQEQRLAPLDDTLQNRLSELRREREEALRLKAIAERQRGLQRQMVAPERMDEFCAAMQGWLRHADIATRKSYLRLFVERIEVDDDQVRMFGHKGALQAGLQRRSADPAGSVPSFAREWRAGRDETENHWAVIVTLPIRVGRVPRAAVADLGG